MSATPEQQPDPTSAVATIPKEQVPEGVMQAFISVDQVRQFIREARLTKTPQEVHRLYGEMAVISYNLDVKVGEGTSAMIAELDEMPDAFIAQMAPGYTRDQFKKYLSYDRDLVRIRANYLAAKDRADNQIIERWGVGWRTVLDDKVPPFSEKGDKYCRHLVNIAEKATIGKAKDLLEEQVAARKKKKRGKQTTNFIASDVEKVRNKLLEDEIEAAKAEKERRKAEQEAQRLAHAQRQAEDEPQRQANEPVKKAAEENKKRGKGSRGGGASQDGLEESDGARQKKRKTSKDSSPEETLMPPSRSPTPPARFDHSGDIRKTRVLRYPGRRGLFREVEVQWGEAEPWSWDLPADESNGPLTAARRIRDALLAESSALEELVDVALTALEMVGARILGIVRSPGARSGDEDKDGE